MMWTTRQEEIVREQCHRGSLAVRDAIERECGVRRTVRAVEAHASRMHVSLKVRSECPQCGAIGVRLNRQTGMCPLCTEELQSRRGARSTSSCAARSRAARKDPSSMPRGGSTCGCGSRTRD